MRTGAQKSPRLNGFLDALASRLGIFSIVGLLVAICIGAGLYIQSVVEQLERNHAVFEDSQIRNSYVAISDINRLILVAQGAVLADEMTPELRREFLNATDILWVRADNLEMVSNRGVQYPSGPKSLQAIKEIVAIADKAIEADFPDERALTAELLEASEFARANLVQYLDEIRRQGDLVLQQQSYAVRRQQAIMTVNLVGLTLIGCIALAFLRREVLARQARAKAEERVDFLAFYDSLTELPNRIQFQERLQEILDAGEPVALMFVDLDDFKTINDTFGHAAGDAVLRRVGEVLAEYSEGKNGFAARLAGDEFAMVVPSGNLSQLTKLCSAIIEEANKPFGFEGETLKASLSIGLATSTQVGEQMKLSVDLLSRVADFALYASKSEGRSQFTVYDKDLEKRFIERREMLEELPKAIQEGNLEVYLQPKVDLSSKQAFGFEALVRWFRRSKIIPPGEFISVAEESGLVIEIDHFVLRNATSCVSSWNREHNSEFSVSVNLSALHFSSLRIVNWVTAALEDSGLPAELLTLEITETVEMRDWDMARSIIRELHALGCKISIDDFGTGFSSLAYLRGTEADELKIDRSLIVELETSNDARLLLASVFEIARNLNLVVVVEGIETEIQAKIIEDMGAQFGQGFLFGRPIPSLEALSAFTSKTTLPEHSQQELPRRVG